MKVGVISDIHGNHHAMHNVLLHARRQDVKKLLVLGDICGYYYHPEMVMQQLADWPFELVKGNHESILEGILAGNLKESDVRRKYGSGHRLAIERLSPSQLNLLIQAPETQLVTIGDVKILMCHGSPSDPNQYLYPDSDLDLLEATDSPKADFVVIGHSHYPFAYSCKHSMLLNVGSIGQSRSLGGQASWLIIDTKNCSFAFQSTPYSTKELESEIDFYDPDVHYLKEVLKRNVI